MTNHLAIAVANVEAFRDGVFEASPARLSAVLQALAEVGALLGRQRQETVAATLPRLSGLQAFREIRA